MATVTSESEWGTDPDAEAKRAVVEKQLWWWNVSMGVLHLIQAIIVLALGLSVGNLKAFKIPLVTSIPVGFAFLSAAAHFTVLAFFKVYLRDLKERKINKFRWVEYALSSSLMIGLIALLFGVWDVLTLVALMSVNACMCLFGLDHELLNGQRPAEWVDWTPFISGCFAGVVPWAIIFAAIGSSPAVSEIPGFVWAILVVYFVTFNTFPINMLWQYQRKGLFSDKRWGFEGGGYYFGERMYQFQSLFTKSLLLWLVVGGSNQPQAVNAPVS